MARSSLSHFLPLRLLFVLLSLLFATVSSLNVSRCDVDTACFINRCGDDTANTWLSHYTRARTEVKIDSCRVILQIKKLDAMRHVIFLRLTNFNITNEISLEIGQMSLTLSSTAKATRGRWIVSYAPFEWIPNLYDIRVEIVATQKDFDEKLDLFLRVMFNTQTAVISAYGTDRKGFETIGKSVTCSTEGLSHLDHLSNIDYEIIPVDFSDFRLSCSEGFQLVAAKPSGFLTEIPDIFCEDNQWQTDLVNVSTVPHVQELIDSTEFIQHGEGNDHFTLTSELSIGCVRRRCAYCISKPPPLPSRNCIDCVSPSFSNATNQLECAQLKCPPNHRFIARKLEQVRITPECYSVYNKSYYWYVQKMGEIIEQLSCKKNDNNEDLEEIKIKEEPAQELQPLAVKTNHTRKNPRNRTQQKIKKTESGDWLRKNWISSILTPLIILAVIGGCIVFLVFVLKTKDEQDAILREERRRDRERREDRFSGRPLTSTDSSGSEEALV